MDIILDANTSHEVKLTAVFNCRNRLSMYSVVKKYENMSVTDENHPRVVVAILNAHFSHFGTLLVEKIRWKSHAETKSADYSKAVIKNTCCLYIFMFFLTLYASRDIVSERILH